MESDTGHGPKKKNEVETFVKRVDLEVRHYRKRLIDSDNPSIKAALDAIVDLGILSDDGPKQIRKKTDQQFKVATESQEKTVFIFTEVED